MIGPIEKGVALPKCRSDYGAILGEMAVGDSRMVTKAVERVGILGYARVHGIKIVTRQEDGKGWRVWLISRPNGISFHHTSLHFKAPHTTAPDITSHQ